MLNKKGYFQGGGGVNEPTPAKKKYKSETAILVQPRFEEPFYHNYDLYDTEGVSCPAKYGPGSGWNHMNEHGSIHEFLDFRRKRLEGKYVADDFWIEDTDANRRERAEKMKVRADLFNMIIKMAADENDLGTGFYENLEHYKSVRDFIEHTPLGRNHGAKIKPEWERNKDINHIDFPVDDEVNHDGLVYPEEAQYQIRREMGDDYQVPSGGDNPGPENLNISFTSAQIAGEHTYLPNEDFDGKDASWLNFGRDYDNESAPVGRTWDESKVDDETVDWESFAWDALEDEMEADTLVGAEAEIYGLPDGVEGPAKDAEQTIQTENPYDTISDINRKIYEDKWNI